MERNAILVLLAACAMGAIAPPARALDTQWVVYLRAADPNGNAYVLNNMYGTGNITPSHLSTLPSDAVVLYCPDRDGPEPYWTRDVRTAEPQGVVMVWNLVAVAGAGYPYTSFILTAWNPTGGQYDIDPNPGFRVVLYKGAGIEHIFDPNLNGSSADPQWSKAYPIAPGESIDDFRLVREPVPEPSGVLAVMSGLVGLAFARRRLRR
jgi:hypothetical protein